MEKLSFIPDFRKSDKLINELKTVGTIKQFRKGDILLNEDAHIASVPIVLSGSLKVFQSDDDIREMLLYYLKAGETCIMSVLGGLFNEVSKIRVECEEDAEILMVPVTKLGALLQEHPAWTNYIFRIYHQRFEELLDVVNAVAFKKMDERMVDLLEKMAATTGKRTLTTTHEELANALGTARVVVSRLLKQMEKEGLVRLGRNQITLV